MGVNTNKNAPLLFSPLMGESENEGEKQKKHHPTTRFPLDGGK